MNLDNGLSEVLGEQFYLFCTVIITDGQKGREQQMNEDPFKYKSEPLYISASHKVKHLEVEPHSGKNSD